MLDTPNTVEFSSDVAVNVATAMVSDPLGLGSRAA